MNRNERRTLKKEPRYQVVLELKDGTTMPHGPTAPKDFCQRVCEGINRALIDGKRSPLNVTGAHLASVASH